MRILIAGSESAPYLKSGGLGDVLGALPSALARAGHDVKLFLPLYRDMKNLSPKMTTLDEPIFCMLNGRNFTVRLHTVTEKKSGLETIFVEQQELFGRPGLYLDSEGEEFSDNDERYLLFCKIVLEAAKQFNWSPDIVHAHDWQTALLPVFLKTIYADDSFFETTRSVLTIHNLAYQGLFKAEIFPKLGLDESLFLPAAPFEFYGKVNFLKAGIMHADRITTVSPNYAREIQTDSELGCGLEGVLQERADDLSGILNGVDYSVWSPSRDSSIPHRYHKANLSGKKGNRVELLNKCGLPIREKTPVVGMVSRLVDQKGFDLIADIAELFFERDLQLVLLGTGDEKYHELFRSLEGQYPDKCKAFLTFNDALAHLIEAGSDIFLMPSRFEPCGLNQMYSLKYGTVPVVRRTGGLADSVIDFDPATGTGTGFVFDDYESSAMLTALDRAIASFGKRRVWTKMMKAGMTIDNSWSKVARSYVELFSGSVQQKKTYCV
ncbi:MAG: glycogen synthase GlgA [bacterium]|nr:glycogen synthase GlgA [bacterium]